MDNVLKRKIVIVFSSHRSLESGGVGTHLRHLIEQLKLKNVQTKVILGLPMIALVKLKIFELLSGFFYKEYNKVNYINNYIYCLYKQLTMSLGELKLSEQQIIIHCHDRYTAMAASLLSEEVYNFKIVQTLHAPFSEQFKITDPKNILIQRFARIIDSGINEILDGTIAVDKLQKSITCKLSTFKKESVVEISNAVDTQQLDELPNDRPLNNSHGIDNYFIVARHLQKKNGVIIAVQGFKKFLERNGRDFKLILMGEGPERSSISEYIKQNNLENEVFLIGKMAHKESLKIIKNATLSIIPSIPVGHYIEATSLTMLESMYLKVPVVASNIGGLAQVIRHNETGILFEPGETEELAASMELLINDIPLQKYIAINGQKMINENYSAINWFEEINKVYES